MGAGTTSPPAGDAVLGFHRGLRSLPQLRGIVSRAGRAPGTARGGGLHGAATQPPHARTGCCHALVGAAKTARSIVRETSMRVSRLAVGTVVFILSSALWLALRLADADVPPAGYGQPSGEFDITLSRVPVSERAAAKALKPPFQPTPEILAEGKAIFLGKGTCFQCHGPERSEEHTSELQSLAYLVCRLLLEKKKTQREYMYS